VPIGFSGRKVVLDVALAAKVAHLLVTKRFDVAHAVEESVFFTLPLARALGVPVIYDLDSMLSEQLAYTGVVRHPRLLAAVRAAERAALRRSTMAITVCDALTDNVRALDAEVPIVQVEDCPLPQALRAPDPAEVRALRARWSLDGCRVAVYTGNLEPYQGVSLLLRAWRDVHARCASARLLIVGGEPTHVERARASLGELPHERSVIFAGHQPPDRLPELMALADVLVSPRLAGENTPLKLYSYMHSGIPIVATDLRTHRQVLDHRTAVLCAPTADALADALSRVLEHPDAYRAVALAARERLEARYSPRMFERKLLSAYGRVLADRPPVGDVA
jgi:glycosyltransferase involved in cell wall biosynthesis